MAETSGTRAETSGITEAPRNTAETPKITYLFRGQKYLVILGAVYVGLVGLLAIPYFQSQYVFKFLGAVFVLLTDFIRSQRVIPQRSQISMVRRL